MSRYGDPNQNIERLRSEAHVADQVIEDLSRALEDSERVCDRYREALVHIDQTVGMAHALTRKALQEQVAKIIRDAMWTRMKEAS